MFADLEETPPPQPSRLKKWFKRIGITVAVIVGIVVAIPIIWIIWTEFPKLRDAIVVMGAIALGLFVIWCLVDDFVNLIRRGIDDQLRGRFDRIGERLHRIESKLDNLERTLEKPSRYQD
jgi:hypothetical protein